MNRSTIKGFAYILSNVLTIISLLVPYYVVTGGNLEGKVNISLISQPYGIIILVIEIICCAMVFAGLQKKCGFSAAVSVVSIIVCIIRMSMGKTALAMNAAMESVTLYTLFSPEGSLDINVSMGPGIYLLIVGAVASIVTGIMFALEDD